MVSEITPITATRDQYTKIPIKGSATFGPDIQVFVTEMDLDAEKTNLIKVQMNTLANQVNTNAQEAEAGATLAEKWANHPTEVEPGLYAARMYAVGDISGGSSKGWAVGEGEIIEGEYSSKIWAIGSPPDGSAKQHATAAGGFAQAAAASATAAANGDTFNATSASTVTISPGEKVFTLNQSNRAYVEGSYVKAVNPNNTDEYVQGNVTDYTDNTLTIAVAFYNGSGDISTWNLMIAVEGSATTLGEYTAEGLLNAAAGGGAVITAMENVTLTADSPKAMSILPVGAIRDIILPDATTLRPGTFFSIFSIGFYDINILDSNSLGGAFYPVAAGEGAFVVLVDNSTSGGRWQMMKTDPSTDTTTVYATSGIATSGTFTVPLNVYQLEIDIRAGGGAGGSYSPNTMTGSGGGGGGYASLVLDVEPGDTITIVAGIAGAPGPGPTMFNGLPGGTTTMTYKGHIITCTGGAGGRYNGAGGLGGTATADAFFNDIITLTDGTQGDTSNSGGTASVPPAQGGLPNGGISTWSYGSAGGEGWVKLRYFLREE